MIGPLMLKRIYLCRALMIACSLCGFVTNSNGQAQYSKSMLQKDLAFAVKELQASHPGLHRYTGKVKMEKYYRDLAASLPDSADSWQAYSHLSQLLDPVKCGHTRLLPNSGAWDSLKAQPVFFPLHVRWLNDSLYVDTATEQKNSRWYRVETINGTHFSTLLQSLEKHFSLDGDIRKGKQLFFENLAYYYAVWIDRPAQFSLQVKSPGGDGSYSNFTFNGITWDVLEERRKKSGIVFGTARLMPLVLEVNGNTALLTIRNFNAQRHLSFGVNFPSFLDSAFRVLKSANIKELVIDIRNNGGGDDAYGALLFSFLTDKPFRYFREVMQLKNGRFVTVAHPQLKLQQPQVHAFSGSTTLLVDGLTFSTAADFAAIFREHKRGRIVGMETGGAFQGNNSGMSKEVRLPNTGLLLSIPLWRYKNAVTDTSSRRGVLPDVEVIRGVSMLTQTVYPL